MKKNYLILLCAALMACNDDDVAPNPLLLSDTVAPEVAIQLPEANDSIVVIGMIGVVADVTDDRQIDRVRVILAEPGGTRRVVSNNTVKLFGNNLEYKLNEQYLIPKNTSLGDYTIMVEAIDMGANVVQDSVTFSLHASDINSDVFARSFGNTLLHSNYTESLDWFGYNYWDYGYTFDEGWLSLLMYLMVSTDSEYSISEAEWKKFVTDFNLKDQSWADWDANSDGSLNEAEFHKGIGSLNFFNDWDRNKDENVDLDEMATGFFTHWDLNKDNVLSREEYLEKFYAYLYRE